MARSLEEAMADLGALDVAVAQCPDDREGTADRIYSIMKVAGAAGDPAKASFLLGQIFEVLRPMRTRRSLLAKRAAVAEELASLSQETP